MSIIWNQKLGKPECPYLVRWVLHCRWFSIRLHHWNYGDDPRAMHDHPWWFWCFVIAGSYNDVTPQGKELMSRWTLKFRPALHRHTVETTGCWTLLLTGPEFRQWGFYEKTKINTYRWLRARRYFFRYGHHPCDTDINPPVAETD